MDDGRRRRILHVTNVYAPVISGQATYVRQLASRLPEEGFESEILTLDRNVFESGPRLPARELVDTSWVTRIPSFGLRQYPLVPAALSVARQFDLLHIHGTCSLFDFLAFTRFLHHKPMVINPHGGLLHTARLRWLKIIYFNTFTRAGVRQVDHVIADGKDEEAQYRPLNRPVTWIPPGIDVTPFLALRRDPRPGHLLTVSRLAPNKRVDLLIRALAPLRKTHPEVTLSVVGADTHGELARLKDLARGLELERNVRFLGEVGHDQLLELYRTAQLFVCASEMEAWGIVACEAMAAGIPCLLNAIPTFQMMAQNCDGVVITRYQESDACAATLAGLLSEPETTALRRAAAGRQKVTGYTIEESARRTAAIYREILGPGP